MLVCLCFAAVLVAAGCGNRPKLVGSRDPRIEVSPPSLDFHAPVGTSTSGEIVVTNVGREPLVVAFASMQPPGEFDVDASALPATLAPGEPISLAVSFHPDVTGVSAATLSIASDDPLTPVAPVALTGKGVAHHVETFTQGSGGNEADVLVMLDEDLGTDGHTEYEGGIDALIHWLEQDHVDFHVGVTGASTQTYGGKLVAASGEPAVVAAGDASPSAELMANCDVIGASTEDDGNGLAGALDALSPAELAGDNAGFLRPEATLDLVWMSDEDDTSPAAVASYRNAYLAVKNTASKVSFAAIADVDSRYQQLVGNAAAFGDWNDPSTWNGAMQSLAASASGVGAVFPLSFPADPTTIVVTVDGVVYPTPLTWTWDAAAHAVRFEPTYVPAAGATIVVDYGEP